MNQTWTEKKFIAPGIIVYKNVLSNINVIERIERNISESNGLYKWSQSQVGNKEIYKDYRDCEDFKIRKNDRTGTNPDKYLLEFDALWEDIRNVALPAVEDYRKIYPMAPLNHWEAMNIVKYGPGHHFQQHSDHGTTYSCVLSMVGYPNDDYIGGDLNFGFLGIKYKAEAGDLVFFPSSFIYTHASEPVQTGTKYAVVTMLDYHDMAHTPSFYSGTNHV